VRLSIALNFILVAALIFVLGKDIVVPRIAAEIWADDYKQLMYSCDHVMREHYIAKRAVELEASPGNIDNLSSAEVGLLQCHDYDKLRKRMLVWGLEPEELSLIGLEALEEKSYELRRFVEIHEFRY